MKKLYAAILLFLIAFTSHGQTDTTYWNTGGNLGLSFNQATLSNWAAGGSNTISGGAYFNYIFDYLKDRNSWQNTVQLGYGLIKEAGEQQRKADDKIVFTSIYGYQLSESNDKWFLSTLLDFRTQFDKGFAEENFDDYISEFMAPGYLIVSQGIGWKASEYFSMNFGPISSKVTFVLDDSLSNVGAFGVDPGDQVRFELGGILGATFNKEIVKNTQFTSNLVLFTNYLEDTDKIDVNWENGLVMKVNEFLSANIYNQMIYDHDVKFEKTDEAGNIVDLEERVQFKNIFGLGLTVRFGGSRGGLEEAPE